MWVLVYWDLSKSPLCLGVGRRNKARAINISSLPTKEFPCKLHQSPKIPWHVIFSFLLLILAAVTVTDSGNCSANPPLNRESFQLPFNFLFNLYSHTFTVFSLPILQFRREVIFFPTWLTHGLSDFLIIVCFIIPPSYNSGSKFLIWELGAES